MTRTARSKRKTIPKTKTRDGSTSTKKRRVDSTHRRVADEHPEAPPEDFKNEFRKLCQSISGLDGTIGVIVDNEMIYRPVGPDRNMLIDAMVSFGRHEISNKKFKEKLFPWCSDDEYNDIDNWFPDEEEVKNEKNEIAFTNDIKEKINVEEIDTEELFEGLANLRKQLTRKLCSSDGCTNIVVRGGLCIRHGAKVKLCSIEGCTNQAKNGEVCIRHGAKVVRKRCSSKGWPIKLGMEECARGMEQRMYENFAAVKDAPILSSGEECV